MVDGVDGRSRTHVRSFSMHELEVPKVVVCCLCLRNLVMRFGFGCMDNIREFYGILNEENWNIVAFLKASIYTWQNVAKRQTHPRYPNCPPSCKT
jgi:hypothetical protein